MGYLDDLIGIKTILSEGSPLPRRATLAFEGAGVEVADDPILGQTTVTFEGSGGELQSFTFEGPLGGPFVSWFVYGSGLAAADIVRIVGTYDESTIVLKIVGIATEDLVRTRKVLVNVGVETVVLVHQMGVPGDWFVLPAEYALEPNACVEVLWLPEINGEPAGWRLVGGA